MSTRSSKITSRRQGFINHPFVINEKFVIIFARSTLQHQIKSGFTSTMPYTKNSSISMNFTDFFFVNSRLKKITHFQSFPLSHTSGYEYSFGGLCFGVSQDNLNFDITSVSFVNFCFINIIVIFCCQPEK